MHRLAVVSMHTSPLDQPGTGDGGGMNVYVHELARALADAGTCCEIFTRATSAAVPEVVRLGPRTTVHSLRVGPRREVGREELAGLVPDFAAAIAQRLGSGAPGGPVAAVHANYWISGLVGKLLKDRLGLPLVTTFHTLELAKAEDASAWSTEPEGAGHGLLPAPSGSRVLSEASVIAASDILLASSPLEASQIQRLYGASADQIEVVPPGVDCQVFSPRPQPGAPGGTGGSSTERARARKRIGARPGSQLLLFAGRIQPLKGADLALSTLAALRPRFPGCELAIVGGPSGPEGQREVRRLGGMVSRLGLEGVAHFVPAADRQTLASLFRSAEVCLVPSRSESFGLVALEAAACGVPVVGFAVGGLQSVVEDGRTGYLVPPGRTADLAERAGRLLADPTLAARMGAAAATTASSCGWDRAAARVTSVVQKLSGEALVDCATS